jgi:hypothetical protein
MQSDSISLTFFQPIAIPDFDCDIDPDSDSDTDP